MALFDFLNFLGGSTPNQNATPAAIGTATPAATPTAAGLSAIATPTTPAVAGATPASSTGLGMNIGTGQLALSGLGALGQLWSAQQAQSMAKKQFDFQRQFATANLNNQMKSYNTALTDRITSRGVAEGRSQEDVDAYIARNRL